MSTPQSQFYVVGGTVNPDSPSYVVRRADQELYDRVLAGDLCYVLTSRQMGKSSLMARTARRLTEEAKIHTAIVDLTLIGNKSDAEQWYYGIAHRILREVGLRDVNLNEWWQSRSSLSGLQRLTEFFRDLLLERIAGQIVIFIDEIDSTISLPFTDDFFAAIRACHNARATDVAYNRLSFVLLGVASPSDLVKDQTRTPFNVGQRIELTDFTAEEAKPLAAGLSVNGQNDEQILASILDWTGGHPYLTQKLCQIVAHNRIVYSKRQVNHVVQETFPVVQGPPEDSNLRFVYDRLVKHYSLRVNLLNLYRLILKGRSIYDDPTSIVQTELKLSGIVKVSPDKKLHVRNRIYERAFTKSWAREAIKIKRGPSPTLKGGIFRFLVATTGIGIVLSINLVIRHPDGVPPVLQSQTATEWRITVINAAIYWVVLDTLEFFRVVFYWWSNIKNPFIKIGGLLVFFLVLVNFQYILRTWARNKKWKGQIASFSVDCPTCGQNAPPIPGTEVRYRCSNQHQFSGAYHGW